MYQLHSSVPVLALLAVVLALPKILPEGTIALIMPSVEPSVLSEIRATHVKDKTTVCGNSYAEASCIKSGNVGNVVISHLLRYEPPAFP
jgi:hypothetical protein